MSLNYYDFGEDEMPIFADENPRNREDRQILCIYEEQVRGHWDYRKVDFRTSIGDYELRDKVGVGKQGIVRKAIHRSGAIVAIKRMNSVSRDQVLESGEMKFLLQLRNVEHVVRILSVVPTDQPYAVFEYAHIDLRAVASNEKIVLSANQVKTVGFQLLRGVDAIHKMNIVHRDIKPSHILISEAGLIKITGFDKAAQIFVDGRATHSDQVGCLQYIAPETLFGHTENSEKLDMWSVGCVLAELAYRDVIFFEDTVNNQIIWMNKAVGPFTGPYYSQTAKYIELAKSIEGVRSNLSQALFKDNTTNKLFPYIDAKGAGLLKNLVHLNPTARPTAEQALQSKWFRGGLEALLRNVVIDYQGPMFFLHKVMDRQENSTYKLIKSRGAPRFRNLLGSTSRDFRYEETEMHEFGEQDAVF